MQVSLTDMLDDAPKITALFRSAIFLGASLDCHFAEGQKKYCGTIIKIYESGSGRKLSATSVDIQLLTKDVLNLAYGTEINASFTVGDLKVFFKSTITSISPEHISIAIPPTIFLGRNRRMPRRKPALSAEGWGTIEGKISASPIRISLKDYTSVGLGLVVSSQIPLTSSEYKFISGVVTSNNLSMRIENAKIIRISQISVPQNNGWISYKVGCRLRNTSKKKPINNARSSRRFTQGDYVRLESELLPGRNYKAKIKNISIRGLSCSLLFPDDITAFPKGAPVRITNIGIRGRVVETRKLDLRIALDLNCLKTFQSWFLRFTEAFHPTMDTWVDFFHQAAISFASSGGVSGAYLKNSGPINNFLEPQMVKLDHNPHWMQMWVEKNQDGNVIGHISCVRYGDNFWYVGDIWGSQLSEIDKEFIKKFFESFVSYAMACAPFPKTIVTLKFGHPYWQKMLEALDKKYPSYISEESLCYKVPLFEKKLLRRSSSCRIEIFAPQDGAKIDGILALLEAEGTRYLAELMGFSVDGFGAPLLRSVLQESTFHFERLYALITRGSLKFLAIFSKYPGGTSIQHHQETIWMFPLGKAKVTPEIFDEVANTASIFCLKLGIFPGYIKLATKKTFPFLPAPMRLIIGDPRMWLLL